MAKIDVQVGSTSVTLPVFIQASTSTQGLGLTGLVGTSAGLQAWYYRGTGTAVPITLATSSLNAAYTSGLFVEVNSTATGIQGAYRFDPPDACFATASNVRSCMIGLGGAVSMAPVLLEVQLTGWNNQIAVQTSVLAAGTHVGAVIPIVQTASGLVGTVVLAPQIHTSAVIPVVQTASVALVANNVGTATSVLSVDTVKTSTLAGGVHTGAIIPIVQTASNLVAGISGTATVILAAGTHTGAVIPVVQTASNVISAQTVQTSSDGRMANLDLNVGAIQTSVATRAAPGDAMTLTGAAMTAVANAYGTTTRPEAYRGSGAAGTPDQLIYEIAQGIGGFSITSTGTVASKNVFKADGTSSAQRFDIQLDTSTQPTGISRG